MRLPSVLFLKRAALRDRLRYLVRHIARTREIHGGYCNTTFEDYEIRASLALDTFVLNRRHRVGSLITTRTLIEERYGHCAFTPSDDEIRAAIDAIHQNFLLEILSLPETPPEPTYPTLVTLRRRIILTAMCCLSWLTLLAVCEYYKPQEPGWLILSSLMGGEFICIGLFVHVTHHLNRTRDYPCPRTTTL